QNFLGNKKSPHYEQIVAKMISDFQKLKCNMNLKLHFLDFHLDKFPHNLEDFSEEQGERFHQDIKVMETRYQGRWDVNIMIFVGPYKRENRRKVGKESALRCIEHLKTRERDTVQEKRPTKILFSFLYFYLCIARLKTALIRAK
ncbi:hypothetical protein ALC62_11568, partial [Cyphomyrmex costatus]